MVILPELVDSAHVTIIAESILRTADTGERDAAALERIALMELRLTPRHRREPPATESALLFVQNLEEFLHPLERLHMPIAGVDDAIAIALQQFQL